VIIPSRALVLLAILPLVLALTTLFDPSLLWPMLATDAAIAFVALVDALLARRPAVSVRRKLGQVFSIGRPNPVEIELHSHSARRLRVQYNADVFDHAVSDELPLSVDLPARSRRSTKFRIQPTRRGAYSLGDDYVRYSSPLGLWLRQLRLPANDPIRVYPDLQAVRTFELLARKDREHSMMRTSRRLGGESEFEQLRNYTRDDEFRSIDWKATARKGQLISRQYQLESNQSLMFVLDAGRLMTAETAGLPLFDHALNATLMLANVAVRGRDHVGMLAFGRDVESYVPPQGGRRAVQKIIHASYALHPQMVEPDWERAFQLLSTRVRKRSLVVIFTQVVDEVAAKELVRLTRSLMPRHLPMVVLFRDVDVDALVAKSTGKPKDLYSRGAAAEVIGWRENVVRTLENQGALVLDTAPEQLTSALINRYLEIKARHLL
jgi:uncharacterized protein (DUF58 family)